MAKLTAAGVRALRTPGKYADGDGLLLDVKSPTRRYWTFRYQRAERQRWMTFGNADDLTLAEARAKHAEARALLVRGLDPLDERERVKLDLSRSFADAAEQCIEAKAPGWRSPRGASQWRALFRDYANPVIGRMPVAEVEVHHILQVLKPLWSAKPNIARRLRVQLEAVLDFATALRWRAGANPAVWRGNLAPLLAAKSKLETPHYPALDWRLAPALMAALAADESMAARCLALLLLTASRSGEARGCRWDEIDLASATWSLPASRMKAGRPHRVPLSPPAVALLEGLQRLRQSGLVFPGVHVGGRLADVTLIRVLRRAGFDVTVHGMRSTFASWAQDHGHAANLVEQSLAHAVGSAVQRAYQRSDVIERRRVLMEAWAGYLTRPPADVVPLRAARPHSGKQ
jgi:integrase